MDLAFRDGVAPRQGQPGGDRGQVFLQSPREAGQLADAAVSGFCHPRLEGMAPALPRDNTAQRGQDALGAVVVSWSCTLSCSTNTLVRRMAQVDGSKALSSVSCA
jgi:hypothetical protein